MTKYEDLRNKNQSKVYVIQEIAGTNLDSTSDESITEVISELDNKISKKIRNSNG